MKSLWLAVIVLSVVLVKTENSDVLVMGDLQTMQTNIHALEQALTSVGKNVDQMMAEQRLSTKVDKILAELSKLTDNLADNMRITASRIDKLSEGMQSNSKALESELKPVITKVDQLMADQRLSKMATEDDSIISTTTTMEDIVNVTIGESRCPENNNNGAYLLRPPNSSPFNVYCEKGWIVIQRRYDGFISFNRMWNEYRNGFGDISTAHSEHWLGLEKIHQITRAGSYELMVILLSFDGVEKTAIYTGFDIGSENEKYRMDFKEFCYGTAGDSLTRHKGAKFSTPDQDNDSAAGNCAEKYKSGWWFTDCYESNLNGPRKEGSDGIEWWNFKGNTGLDEAQMMIRQIN